RGHLRGVARADRLKGDRGTGSSRVIPREPTDRSRVAGLSIARLVSHDARGRVAGDIAELTGGCLSAERARVVAEDERDVAQRLARAAEVVRGQFVGQHDRDYAVARREDRLGRQIAVRAAGVPRERDRASHGQPWTEHPGQDRAGEEAGWTP